MIDHTLSRCASPLDVAKSSGRVLFILCIAVGAVTSAWFFLPLESITSFCSLLVTASFYSWLSLPHKYRGPFPFLLGDSSTLCWQTLVAFRFPVLHRDKVFRL